MPENNTGQGTGQGTAQGTGQTDLDGKKSSDDKGTDDMVPRSELTAVVEERNKTKERLQKLQKSALSDEEIAEYKALKEKADEAKTAAKKAEEDKLAQQGKFKELKERLEQEHQVELKKVNTDKAALQAVLNKTIIDERILRAATGKSADPNKIVKLLKDNAKVEYSDNGEPYVRVFDDDKKPVFDDDGKPASLEWFVGEYIKNNTDLQPANLLHGSGGGSQFAQSEKALPSVDDQSNMSADQVKELRKKSQLRTVRTA